MTDKRILMEIPDPSISKYLEDSFQKGSQVVFYTRDFIRITEIDLDEGTVKDIPTTTATAKGKVIFTKIKDSDNYDYEITEE